VTVNPNEQVIFVDEGKGAKFRSVILPQFGRLSGQANDRAAQKEREESADYGLNIGPVRVE